MHINVYVNRDRFTGTENKLLSTKGVRERVREKLRVGVKSYQLLCINR